MSALHTSSANSDRKPLVPFLKWPGGKRWFIRNHLSELPTSFNRYFEPFMGSASVFFALQPQEAILSDQNAELVNLFNQMKTRHKQLYKALSDHAKAHSELHYYLVRSTVPTDALSRAARTLYLNRSCFNGIYRVNMQGEFNVPKGSKECVLLDTDDFSATSRALRAAKVVRADFEKVIAEAAEGDLIFADPPYTVQHNNNGFVKYNEKLFSWSDQERLARSLRQARERGAHVVATNANHSSVVKLFNDHGFKTTPLSRFSSISGSGASRKQYEEIVIKD
ncbi:MULTISPECIES: DNA adenine methylase [Stenotrophomonas]|jgi:DNA adenine methylase|uniref:DNA adenine methylase n=1 Tax=Stenotrophomonas TaxID=40323 RepID=UPI001310D8D3|nr:MULTISPECIES: Dam family site-specific DNA-(adenine-N6)-methyltransferase [Stenotrophomonas]MCO7456849.1 Dam family site-specific DNA-(adenine-N6)-methyltransferase [Stenotrophomonas maltophilia]MCO7465262.1 Dam family site-specific DNA-(adenine-N6)-methyltransferase [Stenotrophomonas maltophilia]MCO7483087.1 Dam family site-specific DNA-(adenine-N6)-methyltransferase [Stenotrophomonas maltophilia]MCO7491949.1 Dam family site-specific DNA-(adenine-N6)-methyltransferase [Stenotrophomonas malt